MAHLSNGHGVYGKLRQRVDHAVLRALTRIVISLPPVKKALLAKQVDSRYLQALVG